MKQTDLKRAVNLTALVLAAGLLMGLLTGCPHKPKDDPKPQTVTITVKGDTNVTVNDPKTLAVTKGSKWSEVKAKVKVSYKEGFAEAGWKLGNKDGEDLKDDYAFNENKTVFAISKLPEAAKVTITVKGDANVTVNEPKTLAVTKGTKWSEVKAKVNVSYKEGFEANGFKLDSASGEELKDNYAFNENKTVFALSKIKGITYKIEHWQQNIENDEYTVYESEVLSGKAGEDTAAAAKTYEGFTAKAVTQQKIKADSSTVVKIEYDRNIITLKLNLNGGTTNPELEDGADGTKILKGKFGAKVKLENLGKTGNVLEKWTPPLPETFPASSPADTYTASWVDGYIVTIKGDERTEIADNTFKATLSPIQTWNDIKAQVKAKVSLKGEWQGGDYEVYEWRLDDENGQKLTDDYRIDKDITVYAVTNYAKIKFNIDSTGTKIEIRSDKGYSGGEPKGKIIIPEGITEIEGSTAWYKGAFNNCAEITSVKLPQSLTQIGGGAFAECRGLTSINLPQSLTQIGSEAFVYCRGLTSINLPQSLTQIGGRAFVGIGLTSINLPKGLTQIGSEAFALCRGLTSINLPEGLTQIGNYAFLGCTGLTSLTVDSGNAVYKAENNIVYTKDGKTLVCAAGRLTSATILDTVTAISEGAFARCTGLTSIDLPAGLTQIGGRAFADCRGLTSINLPEGLTQIGVWAFSACSGLTSINLPASLTQIGKGAFALCRGLKSAVFEDKTGWAVYDYSDYTGTPTPVNLDDASTAAEYLSETYSGKYWKKR